METVNAANKIINKAWFLNVVLVFTDKDVTDS